MLFFMKMVPTGYQLTKESDGMGLEAKSLRWCQICDKIYMQSFYDKNKAFSINARFGSDTRGLGMDMCKRNVCCWS
jgi:hypothetical protein